MRTTHGTVQTITIEPLGSELVADAAIGALALDVLDAADFAEDGGALRVGDEVIEYASIDVEADIITLAAPLVGAHVTSERVDLWDAATSSVDVECRALVAQSGDLDNDDALSVSVAHALVPLLPEGMREPGQGESVILTQLDDSSEWQITDVLGRQAMISGELIAPGSIARDSLSFTVGTTTATVGAAPLDPATGDLWFDGADGYAMKVWNGAAWVAYQFDSQAIAAGAITPALIDFTARDIGGVTTSYAAVAPVGALSGDLWYDSAHGYRLNRYDGAAWVAQTFGTDAITANAITAALIAANTITAAQIAAATITADRLVAGTLTANEIAAGTITGDRIAAGTLTADLIAVGAIVAGAIAAGALDAMTINAGTLSAGVMSGAITDTAIDDSSFQIDDSGGVILAYRPTLTPTVVRLTGSGNWTVPAGVTSVKVECTGGGGGGGAAEIVGTIYYSGGQSGCGGGYARDNAFGVTPGASIPYQVGAGGSGVGLGTNGGDTYFGPGVSARVTGYGGNYSGYNIEAKSGVGPIRFSGGLGASGAINTGGTGSGGAGGGESAWSAGNGNNGADGVGAVGGAGGSGTAGGNGGAGGGRTTGTAGSNYGGGGGGGGYDITNHVARAGAGGGAGTLVITYYPPGVLALVASLAGVAGTDSFGNAYPIGVKIDPKGGGGNDIAWHSIGGVGEPAFANSWVNYDAVGSGFDEASFYKDAMGFVHLRGMIKSGTLSSSLPAFTLPAGYRPLYEPIFACVCSGGVARVDVAADGRVMIVGVTYGASGGNNGYVNLAPITFMAEN